ncbi:MAG: hypothetical protein GC185_04310 [Alphaproteobacteria bacterium]|nr:hypothetical protein [Alphaproteobacteria bacterium]
MPGDFNFLMINEFKKGIQHRDPALVEKAIEAGVLPDTPVGGLNPFLILLGAGYDTLPPDARRNMSEDEFDQRTRAVVEALFSHGARVAEQDKHATRDFETLADQLLLSEDVVDTSTVVIHAIHETLSDGRPVYQIDPARIVAAHLAGMADNPAVDVRAEVNYVLGALETLHEVVRRRLESPHDDVEREIVAQGGAQLDQWRQPFKRPGMDVILADPALVQKILEQEETGGEGQVSGLRRGFGKAGPRVENPFISEIKQRKPREVMAEIESDFIGLAALKRQARQLVFRQAYDEARAKENLPPTAPQNHSAVFSGGQGTGKSAFARKEAELLVALGLAGPQMVAITHETAVGETMSLQPQSLIAMFQSADIILLELPGGQSDGRPDTPDFSRRMFNALQYALESRADRPVVFITGAGEDVSQRLENAPGLKEYIGNYHAVPDMTTPQLCEVLKSRLEKLGMTINPEGLDIVAEGLETARQKLGTNHFANVRAVERIIDRLPDVVAERLFGQEEDEIKFISTPDKKALMTVTAADIRQLGLSRLLKGAQQIQRRSAGFTAEM